MPDPPSEHRIRTLVSGWEHVCALYKDGTVACWGRGAERALGRALPANTPVRIEGVAGARRLSVGTCNACVLDGEGAVSCWGYRGFYCGDGPDAPLVLPKPTRIAGLPRVRTMETSSSSDRACGIGDDGAEWCWGSRCTEPLRKDTPCARAEVYARKTEPDERYTVFPKNGIATAIELSSLDMRCTLDREGMARCTSSITGGDGKRIRSLDAPGENVDRMSGVFRETCFVLASGDVECRSVDGIVRPPLDTPARTAAAISEKVCATGRDGSLTCWAYKTVPQDSRANPQHLAARITRRVPDAHARVVVTTGLELCTLHEDDSVVCGWERGRETKIVLP